MVCSLRQVNQKYQMSTLTGSSAPSWGIDNDTLHGIVVGAALVLGSYGIYRLFKADEYIFSPNEITSFEELRACKKTEVQTNADFALEHILKEAKRHPQNESIEVCYWVRGDTTGYHRVFHYYMQKEPVFELVNSYLLERRYKITEKFVKGASSYDDSSEWHKKDTCTYYLVRLE